MWRTRKGPGVSFSPASICGALGGRPDDALNPAIGFSSGGLVQVLATFATEVSSVSLELGDWNADADTIYLSVHDAANVRLGTTSFFRPATSYEMNLLSLSTSGIKYASFGTSADDLGFIAIDNFTCDGGTVPLPAGGVLLVSGPALVGALKRKRQA